MRKYFSVLIAVLLTLAAAACGPCGGPVGLFAGAAVADISPTFEPYLDENDDHNWDAGEAFEDLDGDGELDSLWIGGFGKRNPTGVHDPLEARAVALSVDGQVFVLCALDTLGLSLGRIEAIQQRVLAVADPALGLAAERIIVASTHTHAGPDTIGVFGPESLEPGWDEAYLDVVVAGAVSASLLATNQLEPVELVVTHAEAGEGFVEDSYAPEIIDPYVGIVQLRKPDGEAVATLTSISNHPETAWSSNTLISADFPAVLRERLEGEFGGVAVHFSGALGLMQTPADMPERDFERQLKLGGMYADRIEAALSSVVAVDPNGLGLAYGHRALTLALQNFELHVAILTETAEGYLAYLSEGGGECELGCLDVPVSVLRLGDALTLVTIPGEATPELILGGIASPPGYGGPYPDAPIEPHLMEQIETEERFVIGLAFAEVGYLYPKRTYWPDEFYSQRHGPGPDVAMQFMTQLVGLVAEVNEGY